MLLFFHFLGGISGCSLQAFSNRAQKQSFGTASLVATPNVLLFAQFIKRLFAAIRAANALPNKTSVFRRIFNKRNIAILPRVNN
jgi:hypothetical protein